MAIQHQLLQPLLFLLLLLLLLPDLSLCPGNAVFFSDTGPSLPQAAPTGGRGEDFPDLPDTAAEAEERELPGKGGDVIVLGGGFELNQDQGFGAKIRQDLMKQWGSDHNQLGTSGVVRETASSRYRQQPTITSHKTPDLFP
uniref:Uncharacterized protein n=1 Tax=Knipowitschia caucasica TaxID=637954 RepID=A0AAV2KDG9_KNICA